LAPAKLSRKTKFNSRAQLERHLVFAICEVHSCVSSAKRTTDADALPQMKLAHSVSERAKRHLRHGVVALLATAVVSPASAQTQGPEGRFNYRAISFTPGIELTDLGLDSNVFNESEHPKSDMTGTVQPSVTAAMRIGASRIAWSGRAHYTYFRRYTDQGTAGGSHRVRVDVPINRVRLFLTHDFLNAKERPTPEIDVRVRRHEQSGGVGADLQLSVLTRVTLGVDTGLVRFEQTAVGDTVIAAALDRQTDRLNASLLHALTPLTSLTAGYSVQRERFLGDSLRNNRNGRAVVGLAFKPFALLSGRVEGGALRFVGEDRRVPGLTAPAFSADLGYVFKGTTNFGVRADRTVNYSIDDASAFYLQTSYGGSVMHHLTDNLHVALSATRQSLLHQLTGVGVSVLNGVAPLTRIQAYDAGLGYVVSSGVRWGLHATYIIREPIGSHVTRFENLKVFAAVSYGSS
jgi:hypothetical protein